MGSGLVEGGYVWLGCWHIEAFVGVVFAWIWLLELVLTRSVKIWSLLFRLIRYSSGWLPGPVYRV